jgi:methionyl-tRNA formyltransferase
MVQQLYLHLMGQKRILVLCGGQFAFPAIQMLSLEKFLCGVGIGNGDPQALFVLEREIQSNGLPYKSFPDKRSLSKLRTWIDELHPDYIFSISFPFLLSEDVLSYGENCFINFHPGPLPEYRGPMPLFEVLRYQEKETAISVHFMNKKFDEGAIIFEEKIPIRNNETYGGLAVKLSERNALVTLNVSEMLQFGSSVPSSRQDESQARYFEKPELSDTLIQWNRMPADEIISLINACNPWNQGADTLLRGKNIKLLIASLSSETHTDSPGKILALTPQEELAISCLNGQVICVPVISSDYGVLTARQFNALKNIIVSFFN